MQSKLQGGVSALAWFETQVAAAMVKAAFNGQQPMGCAAPLTITCANLERSIARKISELGVESDVQLLCSLALDTINADAKGCGYVQAGALIILLSEQAPEATEKVKSALGKYWVINSLSQEPQVELVDVPGSRELCFRIRGSDITLPPLRSRKRRRRQLQQRCRRSPSHKGRQSCDSEQTKARMMVVGVTAGLMAGRLATKQASNGTAMLTAELAANGSAALMTCKGSCNALKEEGAW